MALLSVIVSDMLLNLDILGSISNHQTLMVDGDRLRFDTRYAQWIRRSVTGDSRAQIRHDRKDVYDLRRAAA